MNNSGRMERYVRSKIDSKSWHSHLLCALVKDATFFLTLVGTFGSLWGLAEAIRPLGNPSTDSSTARFTLVVMIAIISLVIAFVTASYRYLRKIPTGLAKVNRRAARIAHLRRPMWQFEFAKSVLAERLAPIDCEYRDLQEKTSFVYAKSTVGIQDYLSITLERIENLDNLHAVVFNNIVNKFVVALISTEDTPASAVNILKKAESIAELYQETVKMERRVREIRPPDPFEELHELHMAWGQPLRDGIEELFQVLQSIIDQREGTEGSYEIQIKTSENLTLARAELERLEPTLIALSLR